VSGTARKLSTSPGDIEISTRAISPPYGPSAIARSAGRVPATTAS
jgi:hypothetical protein